MNAEEYRWHYDYVRLACDSGFSFHALKSKSINQNIGHLDIQELIRSKDVATIERYINVVAEFNLDGEQIKILDPNFVKIFQISQLAVQYLLFCKRYLDNTVVLIKNDFQRNNEETKNLKRYVEELKLEASNAKKQIKDLKQSLNNQVLNQNINVFQCNECPKAFSSEEYLFAHIKRRHDSNKESELSKTLFQVETDKLQLEIKELKERLNNTEKFIQHDDMDIKTMYSNGNYRQKTTVENTVLTELQHKFELLKNHVENELRILQTQKFDQEKYEKWFETFLYQLSSTHGKEGVKQNKVEEAQQQSLVETKCHKCEHVNEGIKQNNMTQTDFVSIPQTIVPQRRQSPMHLQQVIHTYTENDEKLSSETDDRLEKFEEIIQEKVSGSIEKLEHQMQSFMNKMDEIEKQTKQNKQLIITENFPKNKKTETVIDTVYKKPKIVTKKTKPVLVSKRTSISSDDQSVKTKPPRQKIVKTTHITLPKNSIIRSNSLTKFNDKEDLSNTDTDSDVSGDSTSNESSDDDDYKAKENNSIALIPSNKPSVTSTLGKRSLTSLKEVAFTPEVLYGLQKEIENVLDNRLEELGVSPNWSSLPVRSYQRAMNIVNHQASIFQKNVPNYMQIRAQILKAIDNKIENTSQSSTAPQKYSKFKSLLGNIKNKSKTIKNLNSTKKKIETKSFKKTNSTEKKLEVVFMSPKKKPVEKAQNKIETVHLTPKKKSIEKKSHVKAERMSLQMYDTDSDFELNTKNVKATKKTSVEKKPQTKAEITRLQMRDTDSDSEINTKNVKVAVNNLITKSTIVEKKPQAKADKTSMQMYDTDFDSETTETENEKGIANKLTIKKTNFEEKPQTKTESTSLKMYVPDSDNEAIKNENVAIKSLSPKNKNAEKKPETKAETLSTQIPVIDYDTDTLTTNENSTLNNKKYKPFDDVIRELNTTISLNPKNNRDSISDIPKLQLENPRPVINVEFNEQNLENQSKGVLKSFPSNISLHKKKVLFDLESSDTSVTKEVEKRAGLVKINDGGSTTSIASSILDGPKQKKDEEKAKKGDDDIQELSDISDWDISELN